MQTFAWMIMYNNNKVYIIIHKLFRNFASE
jgi:hypothetical protein